MAIAKARLDLFVKELTSKIKDKEDALFNTFKTRIREERLKTIHPEVIKAWNNQKIKSYITTTTIVYLSGGGFNNKSYSIIPIPSSNSYSTMLNQDNCSIMHELYNQHVEYTEFVEFRKQTEQKVRATLELLKTEKNIFNEFPELKKFEKKPVVNTLPSAEDLTTLKNLLK